MSLALGCGADDTDASEDESALTDATVDIPPPVDCTEAATADPLRWLGGATASEVGALRSVAVAGEMAWTCGDRGGLARWSLAADTPSMMSQDDIPCRAVAADAQGTMVAVARGSAVELLATDDGRVLGRWAGTADIEDLEIDGDRVLVSAGPGGWAVLDLGAELAPVTVVNDPDSDARAGVMDEAVVYIADARGGLRAFDLADGTVLGQLPLDPALDVAWADDRLLVATMESVVTVDVTEPTAPTVVAEAETPGSALRVGWLAGQAVVADFTGIVQAGDLDGVWSVVNVEPLVGSDPLDRTRALTVDRDRGRVYVAQWDGLHAYDGGCAGTTGALLPDVREIRFRNAEPGREASRVVPVRNLGNGTLSISGVESDLPGFSSNFSPMMLEPGSAVAFEVMYTPLDTTPLQGRISILSDDPDQPEYVLPMSVNVRGARVGDPVVPFRNVDTQGRVWQHTDATDRVLLLAYFADW